MSCFEQERIVNVAFLPVLRLWDEAVSVVLVDLELGVDLAWTISLEIRLEGEEFLLEPKI